MANDLTFRIGAELTEIKGALASLQRDFSRVGQAAQQAGGGNALGGIERSAGTAAGAVGRLVAGFVTLAGALQAIAAADELNTLNARIRLVSASTDEYNRAQAALFDLAQRTRTSLGETVSLYTRIAQATRDAGVGQEVLLGVVETINQAVQLSGASTQAAEAALVQLGQGLASGALRGEELNSVLEQTPALADAIAKGLGVTRGELRQLGQDGRLTAEQVITALQQQRDAVAQQFAQLPLTVGQSVTLLRNASLQLLGAFNDTTGATAGLADVIRDLATFLGSDAAIGAVIEFSATWSNAFRLIADDVQAAVDLISRATQGITGQGENLFGFIARAFRELPLNVRAAIQIATVNIAAFVDSTATAFGGLADYIRAVFDPDVTIEQVRTRLLRAQAAIEQARQAGVDDALRQRQQALDDAAQARRESEQRRQQARSTRGSTAAGTFRARPDAAAQSAAAAQRKAELDAEEKLAADSARRQLGILEQLYEDGRLAAANYFAAREAIELQALDRAIAIERQRATGGTPADRAKALAEIEILERQKGDVQRRVARENAAAARAVEDQLAQARVQQLQNEGRTAEAERLRLEAQYRDLLARLEAEGNTAGQRLIRGLIDTGVAAAQFQELQAQAERAFTTLERRRQEIAQRVAIGAITGAQGRQEEAGARTQALADLQRINAEIQALAATTSDPQIVDAAGRIGQAIRGIADQGLPAIEQVRRDLRSALADMEANFARAAASSAVDAITGFFTDLASGSKSAGEALRDFVRGFVASMAQIAARALATFLVLRALDAIYPGLGQTVAGTMQVGARVNHGGGMAGTGPRRSMPAWVFAGAPRFHSGGMVGLKPGEVPAVLQTGEEVLSRSDPRNQANGGGSGYRIVNVLDPSLVSGYLESSSGERAVLNVIGRNPSRVRQIIGA